VLKDKYMLDSFVPGELLELIFKDNNSKLRLGSVAKKEVTIFFSDIRSFTTISESMDPEKLFRYLNNYFKLVAPIIRKFNGIIDKYIGDAILAIFLNPEDAVMASIEIEFRLGKYNKRIVKIGYPSVQIGIGIHTGDIMAGILGEKKRMEATVISDTVNLASRLEDLNKTYGSTIIISETVFNYLEINSKNSYHIRFLDIVQVKGKHKSTLVYELYDFNPKEEVHKKDSTKKSFQKGVILFHDKKYEEAANLFHIVIQENPNDRVAVFYLHRTAHFLATGYSLVNSQSEKKFIWTNKYEIGVNSIDDQHKKLFDIINDLYWATSNSCSRSFIEDVLQRLLVYTIAHFSVEEELMIRFKIPNYAHHRDEHEGFKEKIGSFFKAYKAGEQELSVEILDFLNNWLIHHTTGLDKSLGKYINATGEEVIY
jgi:hemerythrin-like metal-binding protein